MSIRVTTLAAVAAAAAILASPASAGTPGKWTMLGSANLVNIDEASLTRTPDGTLHAVWTIPSQNNGGNGDTLVHDAISADGTAAAPNVITGNWAGMTNVPDLVTMPDGSLRVFFGGIRTTNAGEPNSNMNTATAPASGSAWDLFNGTIVKADSAYAGDDGAAVLPDGTPLLSFGGTGAGVFVHRGLDQNTPNFSLQQQLGGCCGYSPDIAVDPKGPVFVAWISNATNKDGVWAQSLDPATGAPSGGPTLMPGSVTTFNGVPNSSQQLQRIPIVARATGGVYVAYPGGYPVTGKVLLWRIADQKSAVLANTKFNHIVSLAAAPDGRIWVVWVERSSPSQVFARRSNKDVTKFGPEVKAGHPPAMTTAYKIDGNAQAGALDIVGLFGGATGNQAQWHTQVLPGLAIAGPAKINGTKQTAVKFTVTDPSPVKGAKLSAGGKTATTDAGGHATIKLGPTGAKSITAKATKAGYTSGSKKIKVTH